MTDVENNVKKLRKREQQQLSGGEYSHTSNGIHKYCCKPLEVLTSLKSDEPVRRMLEEYVLNRS